MIVQGRLLLDPGAPPAPGWVRIDPGAGGRIEQVNLGEPPSGIRVDVGGPWALVVPAFVDAHFHFPQVDSVGCEGMELLDWLDRVIFPAETWWGRGAASSVAMTAARRLVREGTMTVAGYLTSHGVPSREAAVALAQKTPLRLLLGRVGMDRMAPDDLTAEDRERGTHRPIPSPLLAPYGPEERCRVSANPRFAISCTEELLAEFGWLVRDRAELFVQTHLAETRAECALVRELFPDSAHYTGVYDALGLLTRRTLLAHCLHLSREEWMLIGERGSVAVHCPGANTFLMAGLFDLDAAERHGVRVALGSDVAAGPDIAMPRVGRAMIEVAKIRAMIAAGSGDPRRSGVRVPAPAEVFELITRGNARAIAWDDVGALSPGHAGDVLVLRVPETWFDEHLVGRLLYNWSSRLIESRISGGRLIDPDTLAGT
ncbi:MAG: amidohydrolase family protein [Phycisphaerales bacterium]